jgi:uncharacterized protein
LSGTGKSALSSRIAPLLGRAPGAIWLRSDIERKRLFGVGEMEHLPQDAYSKAATREVYALLCRKAALALKSGQSVIIDAVHSAQSERDGIASVAAEHGVGFTGLWLEAPLETRLERVTSRTRDASDATAAVATEQTSDGPTLSTWRRIDASGGVEGVTRAALRSISPKTRQICRAISKRRT